jgi:branched-chain amino acid transport system permease protein
MINKKTLANLIVIVVLIGVATFINQPYLRHVIITACIFSTLSMFYNLTYGFVGIYNFGFAAFFGIGAYSSAILSTDVGIPVVFSMIMATLISALFGFVLMIPCLRMHGYTPGIVTLAFGEIIRILIIASADLTNGEMGYWGIVPLFESDQVYLIFAMIMMIAVMMGILMLMRSNIGLAFHIIKDDQLAAQSVGSNIKAYKLLAMSLSCGGAGLVGAFYAHYLMTITPAICGMTYTIQILCMALFGGVGTIVGPAIGGFSLTVLTEALRFLNDYRLLIYGILIVVIIMFFPKGLMGVAQKIKELLESKLKMEGGSEVNVNVED